MGNPMEKEGGQGTGGCLSSCHHVAEWVMVKTRSACWCCRTVPCQRRPLPQFQCGLGVNINMYHLLPYSRFQSLTIPVAFRSDPVLSLGLLSFSKFTTYNYIPCRSPWRATRGGHIARKATRPPWRRHMWSIWNRTPPRRLIFRTRRSETWPGQASPSPSRTA